MTLSSTPFDRSVPTFNPVLLRQMTIRFLRRVGFKRNDRIWLRFNWSLPIELVPQFWNRYERNGTTHLQHYVFCGKVTRRGFSLRQCVAAGKTKHGQTRWRVKRKVHRDGWQLAFNLSMQGATVCFYPNQPDKGISNHHVTRCPCLFYEIDDLPLEAQVDTLKTLIRQTGLRPAAVVHSGGKSLHVYFRSATALHPDQWLTLNRKLCIMQGGDPQICNLARSMRLPGMVRRKAVDGKLSELIPVELKHTSRSTYDLSQLESGLDQLGLFPHGLDQSCWQRWVKATKQAKTDDTVNPLDILLEEAPVVSQLQGQYTHNALIHRHQRASGQVTLEACLTRDDQALIDQGMTEGSRNASGYKLARNLIGTATFLSAEEIRYEGEPHQLFKLYCQRCSPALDDTEVDRIWQSANSGNPSPSRSPDSILNTVSYLQRQAQGQSQLRKLIARLRTRRSAT